MTAYYNEFDRSAALWLRELIVEGLIAPGEVDERSIEDATSGQALRAGSASDQAMNGTSGTEPTPSSARCSSSSCAMPQASGALACAQHQAHGARRTTRTHGEPPGSFGRSDADSRLEGASLSSSPCMWPLLVACASGIRGLTSRCLLAGTRRSKATCCAGRGLSGTTFRTAGSCDRLQPCRQGLLSCMRPCKPQNNTSGANETQASAFRIERTWGEFPRATPLI